MRYIYWYISLFLLLSSPACQRSGTKESRLPDQDAPAIVPIHRYEKDLFSADTKKLKTEIIRLMPSYPLFLGESPPDTASLLRLSDYLKDTLIQAIYQQTMNTFPDLDSLEMDLGKAFSAYSGMFPGSKIPTVFTYISGIDYEYPVRLADTSLIIALDMYLGQDCRFYAQSGIPKFRCLGFSRDNIVPDVMKEMVYSQMSAEKRERNLVEWMVLYGKMMVAMDFLLPDMPDYQKIVYLPEQLQWCRENEARIWSFFIANKLLFTGDTQQIMNFISDSPFTKGMSKESPGRIGWWVGWQIVRSYMEKNPGLTLQQLLQMRDEQEILNKSGYKPGKK